MNGANVPAPVGEGGRDIPVLTIAIPTRNRANRLRALMRSLEPVLTLEGVECLVIDNASTDDTWQVKDDCDSRVVWEKNERNLGLEGNIIKALLAGTGRYKWLLSDHMLVADTPAVAEMIHFLRSRADLDIGCVGIREYDGVRSGPIVEAAGRLTRREFTGFCFNLSNISSLLVRQNFVFENLGHIEAFAPYAYPHLGLICGITSNTLCLHVPAATTFQRAEGFSPGEVAASYNTFRCRFLGMPTAFRAINESQRSRPPSERVQRLDTFPASVREFRRNLIREMARVMMFPNELVTSSDFLELLRISEGASRLGLGCLFPFFLARNRIGPGLRLGCRLVFPEKYRRLSGAA